MDKYLWFIVPVAAILTGVYLIIWPKQAALQNRDDKDDTSPPSQYEICYTRGVGIFLLLAGAYGLYRMLGGTWGAGPPGEPFDPVLI
jgi:hypothetical protein